MKRNLYHIACEYVKVIDEIETSNDTDKLKNLDESRIKLHWEFIELLKQQGIKYKDSDHATRIAIRIAKEEL